MDVSSGAREKTAKFGCRKVCEGPGRKCGSLCESRARALLQYVGRGGTERGDQCPRPILKYWRDATLCRAWIGM